MPASVFPFMHTHPHAEWAQHHVRESHGKSEAWYILTIGEVFLGLRTPEELLKLVDAQDIETLLSLMHRLSVKLHQTVYIPAGLLHAIGEGILLSEVQEPEDLSILLEWQNFKINGSQDGHLGLGFETSITAIKRRLQTEKEIAQLVSNENKYGSVVVAKSSEHFILERLRLEKQVECNAGFAILIALGGELVLGSEYGKPTGMKTGGTAAIPHSAGKLTLRGSAEVLIARPPPKGWSGRRNYFQYTCPSMSLLAVRKTVA